MKGSYTGGFGNSGIKHVARGLKTYTKSRDTIVIKNHMLNPKARTPEPQTVVTQTKTIIIHKILLRQTPWEQCLKLKEIRTLEWSDKQLAFEGVDLERYRKFFFNRYLNSPIERQPIGKSYIKP